MDEKKSWYDEKVQKIDKETLLSLYTRYHKSMDEKINRHFNVRNYYTVLLSALLGLYIAGISQLVIAKIEVTEQPIPYLAFLLIPIMVIIMSVIALFSTTRYYTAFLRMVTLVAKIENMLGIDGQVKTEKGRPKDLIWEKSERFMLFQIIGSLEMILNHQRISSKEKNFGATISGLYVHLESSLQSV